MKQTCHSARTAGRGEEPVGAVKPIAVAWRWFIHRWFTNLTWTIHLQLPSNGIEPTRAAPLENDETVLP